MANFETLPGAISVGDLSTSQFSFVYLNGSAVDFEVALSTAATVRTVGVLQNDPDSSGAAAEVAISGVCKVKFGGSITQGDFIITGVGGLALTEAGAPGDYKVAQALQTGTATGIYYVKLLSPYRETTA